MSETHKNQTILRQLHSTYTEPPLLEIAMHSTDLAFSKLSSEKNPIFLGMEWETKLPDSYKTQKEIIQEALKTPIKDYVNYSYGGYPLEMRTIPATALFLKQALKKYMFDTKLNRHFEEYSAAGIHIHIDKRAFTKETLKKFIIFVCHTSNKTFIESIGGRPLTNKWCRPAFLNLKFMKDGKTIRGTSMTICDRLQKSIQESEPSGKNVAVNTHTDFKTVEFRIFATQTSEQKVLKNLEFTDALVRYVRTSTYNKLTPEAFVRWLLPRADLYPYLMQEPVIKKIIEKLPRVKGKTKVMIKYFVKGKIENAKDFLKKTKTNITSKKSKVS